MEERKLLDCIEIKREGENTYEAYDLDTGEILNKNDPRLDLAIDEYEKLIETNKANKKAVKKVQGKIDLSENHHLDWKKKSYFIKTYRTEMREYKKQMKLSSNASLVLFHLQDYIEFGTNRVIRDKGLGFNNSEIAEITGVSVRSINTALKELEEKVFIIRKGNTHSREIYINPFLMCAGNVIEKDVVNQFKEVYTPLTSY